MWSTAAVIAAKETIDETRRRLASPEWRRQEREGHAVGILLLFLPLQSVVQHTSQTEESQRF